MKFTDIIAAIFLALVTFGVGFFYQEIGAVTLAHPFLLGFTKLFLLGTFGEMLKNRLSNGTWKLDKILIRAVVWGFFGIWFTWAFAFAAEGTIGLIKKGLWLDTGHVGNAFSTSLWLHMLGGYAYFMMLVHEYINFCIKDGRLVNTVTFGEKLNKRVWFRFIPLTLFIWLVLHTFTFTLEPQFRVLSAALLAIVLGFLLSFGKK
jgi:hypothetical protein